MKHASRPAYTLLEVLLALAIAVLLLGGLYVAINVQLRSAQVGRDTIEGSTLARNLFNRVSMDVGGSVNLPDPARFRRTVSASGASLSSSTASTSSSSSTTGSGTSGTGSSGTGASGSGTAGSGNTGASGSGSSTSGSSSTSSSNSSSSSTLPPPGNVIVIPYGVQGNESQLTLYLSKYPREVYPNKPNGPVALTSDLRRVTYWMADGNQGLARQEVQVITSADAAPTSLPTGGDEKQFLLAPEVRSLQFSYFDGTTWQTSWDATGLGPDGVTPIGPPRAIAVEVQIARPSSQRKGDPILVSYRHVIAIPMANGATTQPNLQPGAQTAQQATTQQGGGN